MHRHPMIRILAIPRHIIRKVELSVLRLAYGSNFVMESGIHISSPLGIQLHESGKLTLESGTIIEKDGILNIHGYCKIGRNVYISARFLLGCTELVTIGDNVAIGPNVVIVDTNKIYSNLSIPISNHGRIS